VDANETAIQLLKLVAQDYSLDNVIEDYKKALNAVGGSIVISNPASNVLGKTGGRNVPIVKQHHDIKARLTETIAASAGSAVQSSIVQF
jgi:hypothetical protein